MTRKAFFDCMIRFPLLESCCTGEHSSVPSRRPERGGNQRGLGAGSRPVELGGGGRGNHGTQHGGGGGTTGSRGR